MTALAAFGIVDQAPLYVSDALRVLKMSHTYAWRDGLRTCSTEVNGLCKQQPVWPVVVDSVRTLQKIGAGGHFVFFVVDSRAALSHTNISNALWPETYPEDMSFLDAMKACLVSTKGLKPSWEFERKEPSLMDYVNAAVKPSFLSDLQSQMYKINPYAFRKEVQAMCILYLAGRKSQKAMKAMLKTNLRLYYLLELMTSEKAQQFRDAVLRLHKELMIRPHKDAVDMIVKETGFMSFELLYVYKSATKLEQEQA